jgi:glycosyltransferase involved in cell wall biosynthesis
MQVGLLASRRIAAAERRRRFDVVHFHTQATAYASLGRMRRTPAIVSIDATQQLASQETTSALSRRTYYPNIVHDGFVFRAAAAITATSAWAARDLAGHYPDCAAKLHVMPYPVRTDFDVSWIDERAARAAADPRRPVQVMFMGGDFVRKGGLELLAVWGGGRFNGRAVLDLVTDWPVERSTLPSGVRVIGGVRPYTPDWTDAWRRADVFVMPTRHEAFGMVFQEAAAAGVPAIATDINAVPEIVLDGRTGLLVPPGDGAALARALDALVDAPDLRRRLGAEARERIRRVGSLDHYADRLRDVVEQVARHGLPGGQDARAS